VNHKDTLNEIILDSTPVDSPEDALSMLRRIDRLLIEIHKTWPKYAAHGSASSSTEPVLSLPENLLKIRSLVAEVYRLVVEYNLFEGYLDPAGCVQFRQDVDMEKTITLTDFPVAWMHIVVRAYVESIVGVNILDECRDKKLLERQKVEWSRPLAYERHTCTNHRITLQPARTWQDPRITMAMLWHDYLKLGPVHQHKNVPVPTTLPYFSNLCAEMGCPLDANLPATDQVRVTSLERNRFFDNAPVMIDAAVNVLMYARMTQELYQMHQDLSKQDK
jgi:hypothetical protein